MDGHQFDRLTQQLGEALSRRRFGAVLAALGLGTGFGAATRAKPKKGKKKKKKPKPCAAGTARCGAACVDIQSNAQHCGGCNQPCPGGQSCGGGQCQPGGCEGNQERCGGNCVNLNTDEQHCGECNRACNGDLTCLDGDCACAAGTRCGTACVDLDLDHAHCGECDRACNGDLTCSNGECGCAAGTRCGNQCVDTQTNRNHCGGCDDACPGNQTCSGGTCVDPPECTNQAQCGGSSFNDLVCRNGRCVCAAENKGICRRFPDGRGSCHECCPGGSGLCTGEHVCHVTEAPFGVTAICNCPTGSEQCRAGNSFRCVTNPQSDPQKCGLDCVDCTTSNPGSSCCNGFCTRGCEPDTQCGGLFGPCGGGCSMCGPGTICCNRGPGTTSQCIPNINGFCYLN
jgi:hypothetical protein